MQEHKAVLKEVTQGFISFSDPVDRRAAVVILMPFCRQM
jgi:hypothetical protein